MARAETSERKAPARKKANTAKGPKAVLRSVVGTGIAGDTLIDLVERLGIVDVIISRVKARIDEADFDDVIDEVTDYLRRSPEVLVVSLGAVTVAAGLMVWLNSRREWDGDERREPRRASRE
ncbi:MAG TPA: hypothetical protein VGQ76_23735 [Thermoanaerobaculia bacterium]|jgi:hypothetical protein|nr:hypothetical protein [Thermoanaerobaculia bacterium]